MKHDYVMTGKEALKTNIKYEKNILREASLLSNQLDILNDLEKRGFKINKKEKKLLAGTVNALLSQLKILNNSLPEIIRKISFFRELPEPVRVGKKKEKLVRVEHKYPVMKEKVVVTIKKSDKLKFLRELSLADDSVKRLKKEHKELRQKIEEFKKPSIYAKISNKFFLNLSTYFTDKGYFTKIGEELRKANLYFLSSTYISMAFFSGLLALLASFGLLVILLFFSLSFKFPFLILAEESILLRFLKSFWVVIALPVLTFVIFYFYPSTEKKSVESKINQELPFVTIHMSAIAGSGVEPTRIFRIIVESREYPNTKKEVKKLLNEINIYGYDLVTALRNSSRVTSSAKLAELFKGLATTITSGGSLKEFLDKRSESLVFDYRMEREKYTHVAETFMDIYISIVIAAPMIMTMLLVMINLTGLSFGFSLNVLILLMLLGIAMLNIFFLVFLHLKQPGV